MNEQAHPRGGKIMRNLSFIAASAALACSVGCSGKSFSTAMMPSTQSTGIAMAAGRTSDSSQFGRNLILNAGAEENVGASASSGVVKPKDWQTTGPFTVVQYASSVGLSPQSPGPSNRGKNYFAGGPSTASSSAKQSISLAPSAAAIDGGKVQFSLSAWLGGFEGQADHATVTVTFEDARGTTLGSKSIGPVLTQAQKNESGLWQRQASGPVPVHSVTAVVKIVSTREAGSYDDGYADNLSLILTK